MFTSVLITPLQSIRWLHTCVQRFSENKSMAYLPKICIYFAVMSSEMQRTDGYFVCCLLLYFKHLWIRGQSIHLVPFLYARTTVFVLEMKDLQADPIQKK